MNTIKKLGLVALLGLGIAGCGRPDNKFQKGSDVQFRFVKFDQVFRDNNGYRIFYDDSLGAYTEEKFYDGGGANYTEIFPIVNDTNFVGLRHPTATNPASHVQIYRDLELNEKNEARIIEYSASQNRTKYVELHMPKNGRINAGTEAVQNGKTTTTKPMQEMP